LKVAARAARTGTLAGDRRDRRGARCAFAGCASVAALPAALRHGAD
jgi:hypothetical protein